MKRKTKEKLNSVILAAIISVPIVIAKVNTYTSPEPGEGKPSECETEQQVAANNKQEAEPETETMIIEEMLGQPMKQPEIATEEATEVITTPQFEGYDFIPLDKELQKRTKAICDHYEIAYDLVISVMKTESEFTIDAIGDNGSSIGLMQIQPQWWQGLADAAELNINEPDDNIELGIIILTDALNANMGDLIKALKQYNSGNPNFESDAYINAVFENYKWVLDQKASE